MSRALYSYGILKSERNETVPPVLKLKSGVIPSKGDKLFLIDQTSGLPKIQLWTQEISNARTDLVYLTVEYEPDEPGSRSLPKKGFTFNKKFFPVNYYGEFDDELLCCLTAAGYEEVKYVN